MGKDVKETKSDVPQTADRKKKKSKRGRDMDYFDMFVQASNCACKAANMLNSFLADFHVNSDEVNAIHEVENEGDRIYHELVATLSHAFITPIEREDIIALAQAIDDLTDNIEDIAVLFDMFNITSIRSEANEFMNIIVRGCETVKKTMIEFRNFKKSKVINGYVIEINHLEEEGDRLYRRAVRRLFDECYQQPVEIIRWREVFDMMERCCDTCEEVADLIEGVVMKNT